MELETMRLPVPRPTKTPLRALCAMVLAAPPDPPTTLSEERTSTPSTELPKGSVPLAFVPTDYRTVFPARLVM